MNNFNKNFNNNFKILRKTLCIACFFGGFNIVFGHFVPNKWNIGLLVCFISLIFLYMDDGKIDELYNLSTDEKDNKKIRNIIATIRNKN